MPGHYAWECGAVVAKKVRHGLFAFLRHDAYIGRSLDLYGEWCEAELRVLRQITRPGDTVLDVGANIGTHTVPLAAAVGPAGTVHAFEPQRRLFQLLCANVALNGHAQVVCHPAAAGARAGEMLVPPLPDVDRPQNFGGVSLVGAGAGEPGRVMTVDGLGLAPCRLIKIDVEGMEADVIAGAAATLAAFRPALYVENDRPGPSSRRTNEAILAAGYVPHWHISPFFEPTNFFAAADDIFAGRMSANLLCFHRDSNVPVIGMTEFLGPDDDCAHALTRMRARGEA